MRSSKGAMGLIVVLISAVAAIYWQLRLSTVELVALHQEAQASELDLQKQAASNRSLSRQTLTAEELEHRRGEHAEISDLRNKIASLRRVDEAALATPKVAEPQPATALTVMEGVAPPTAWREMGRATPAAAMETALWAGARGDTEKLASMLELDAQARVKAAGIISTLAPELREQYGTPEQLVAFLTVKDIPQGGAGILNQPRTDGEFSSTRVQLENGDGESRKVNLLWRRHGETWSLFVQSKIVENYAAKLQGEPLPWPQSPWKK